MGTWGPGNFENDYALDYLGLITNNLVQSIKASLLSLSPEHTLDIRKIDSVLMPGIDILVQLCEHYGTDPEIDEYDLEQWKDLVLQAYDRTIDEYSPGMSSYRTARRDVIETTFSRLEAIIRSFSDDS